MDVISACNLSYAAMLSSTTEISHPKTVESIDIYDLCIHGNGSLAYLISNYRTHYLTEVIQGTHL